MAPLAPVDGLRLKHLHDDELREGGRDAAEEIEHEVARVAEGVLDVIPEDKEEQHVPRDVQQIGVQEHRREDRYPERARPHRRNILSLQDLARDRDVVLQDVLLRGRVHEVVHIYIREDVESDQEEVDVGKGAASRVVVAEWYNPHGLRSPFMLKRASAWRPRGVAPSRA